MSGLPEIVRGGVRFRLPLTPEAAACLAAALLADAPAERFAWLGYGLTHDPPLALWCALQAPEPTHGLTALESLCDWLAPRLAGQLAQTTKASDPAEKASQAAAEVCDLLALSRAVARAAGEVPGADADSVLLGLLHRAVDWLMLSGISRPQPKAAASLLPGWLAVSLASLDKPDTGRPDASEARVRAAIARVKAERGNRHDTGLRGPNPPAVRCGDTLGPAGPAWLSELVPQLAARIARLEQLGGDFDRAVEQAKLEALKEFAYGAGHEINNPLANISAEAQTLLKDESDPERRQKLAAINAQAFRAHEMIADLMLFARPPEMKPQRIALPLFLAEIAKTWKAQAFEQQTDVELRIADDALAVWADSSALAVALRALVTNALEALGRGGRIEIAARPAPSTRCASQAEQVAGDAVQVSVHDNGPGIPAEIRRRLFDPYFSGREAGRGLGFGLCKCWRIVTALGGRIDVASDVGAGATFTMILPGAPAEPGR